MNDELDIDDIKAPEQAPPLEDLSIAVQHGDVLPRKALVDSKWVAALKSVVKQAKGLVIKDAPSLQLAVNLQSRLTEARKQITKSHDDLKAPYLAAGRAIDEAVKAPYAEIDAAVEVLRKLQVDFANAERDRVAREERERHAEIARLQRIADVEKARQAREAAARAEEVRLEEEAAQRAKDAKAAEAAAMGKPAPEEFDIEETAPPAPEPLPPAPPPVKSEAQVVLEQAMHAPVPKATQAVGVQMRTTLEIENVDVAKLPDPFVTKTANLQALRAAYCVKWTEGMPVPVVEGVTFRKKELPVTRAPRV